MKRTTCALGLVMMSLWLAGDPIAAEGAPAEEVAPAVQAAPAEMAPLAEASGTPAVFGELLFLKPTLDDTYFAISSATSSPPPGGPNGWRVNNDFDFEPAFRLGASYEFADSGRVIELSYTRLDAEVSETVRGSFLWATRGSSNFGTSFENYTGSASAEIDATYQRIDTHLTQAWQVSGLDLGLQFGFEWADFRIGEQYAYTDSGGPLVGSVSTASRSWGIGPEIGLGLGYEICEACGIPGSFRVGADASVGALLTETHTRANEVILGAPRLSVRDESTSRVIPAIHARFGVGYAMAITDRVAGTFRVGYQIDSYLRGLSRILFVDDIASGQSTTDYYDFDLQGVYATFGVVF